MKIKHVVFIETSDYSGFSYAAKTRHCLCTHIVLCYQVFFTQGSGTCSRPLQSISTLG
jgi:hypothetical protein